MDFSSFLTSLGTSFVIFIVLMLIFAWLSGKPGNEVIYYPNRILKGLDPSSGTRSPISWIKEAFSSTEDEIISISGVDTAVYFVYLSSDKAFGDMRTDFMRLSMICKRNHVVAIGFAIWFELSFCFVPVTGAMLLVVGFVG